jgi:hypothetical protein
MSEAAIYGVTEDAAGTEPAPITTTFTQRIRERPLMSLGLAGLGGFIIGGGASSRTGAAILMLFGRSLLRQAATEALVSAMTSYGTAKRDGSSRSGTRRGAQRPAQDA